MMRETKAKIEAIREKKMNANKASEQKSKKQQQQIGQNNKM